MTRTSLSTVVVTAILSLGWGAHAGAEAATLEGGVSDVTKITTHLKEGDMIFVQSHSDQAKYLTLLTDSHMTHCGILFKDNGRWVVYEGAGRQALEPSELAEWRKREVAGHTSADADVNIYVRRLTTPLTEEQVKALKVEALKLHHTPYDKDFAWNNKDNKEREKIYCSELLYKAYDRALDIQLVILQTYGQLLAVPANVQKIKELDGPMGKAIQERIKEAKKDDPVVSPGDLIRNKEALEVVLPTAS